MLKTPTPTTQRKGCGWGSAPARASWTGGAAPCGTHGPDSVASAESAAPARPWIGRPATGDRRCGHRRGRRSPTHRRCRRPARAFCPLTSGTVGGAASTPHAGEWGDHTPPRLESAQLLPGVPAVGGGTQGGNAGAPCGTQPAVARGERQVEWPCGNGVRACGRQRGGSCRRVGGDGRWYPFGGGRGRHRTLPAGGRGRGSAGGRVSGRRRRRLWWGWRRRRRFAPPPCLSPAPVCPLSRAGASGRRTDVRAAGAAAAAVPRRLPRQAAAAAGRVAAARRSAAVCHPGRPSLASTTVAVDGVAVSAPRPASWRGLWWRRCGAGAALPHPRIPRLPPPPSPPPPSPPQPSPRRSSL